MTKYVIKKKKIGQNIPLSVLISILLVLTNFDVYYVLNLSIGLLRKYLDEKQQRRQTLIKTNNTNSC